MLLAWETGGAWTEEETARELSVSVERVREWRAIRRILAMPDDRGTTVYPAAQFAPGKQDAAAILPGLERVIAVAGEHLHPRELFGILATHQAMLATSQERSRTGFAALVDGDADAVVAMLVHVTTEDDHDAPVVLPPPKLVP